MAVISDQFFVLDPGSAPSYGTALTVQQFAINDANNDNYVSTSAGDTVGGLTVTSVWVGDQIRVRWPDNTTQWITGVTFYRSGGSAVFTPTDGTVLQNATFLSSTWVNTSTQVPLGDLGPACFGLGTLIETDRGVRPIETLTAGQLVRTLDNGLQPVRWIGRTTVRACENYAPVHIAPGALGNMRALIVSQQHRVLLRSWQAELMFGEPEVLVAAKHLVNGDTIHIRAGGSVTYLHLLFDRHEVVFSEGIATESYFADGAADRPADAQSAEILALFPELAARHPLHGIPARPVLRGYEAATLVA
ncbi:Hint domain-containing protein [Lutimaribacter pacificus]|uniref:Hint domain-containing protein n=1 Tax=Lutimaribacter pacificus TaxID=391948 RepID=A0A1H0E7H5_9RHOB|nr:Hint domain-containing protein [Lutimaribacter pacificus]SHK55554.1 Hint domain-containing protein [Lutimaribacter pacificus]